MGKSQRRRLGKRGGVGVRQKGKTGVPGTSEGIVKRNKINPVTRRDGPGCRPRVINDCLCWVLHQG